MSSRTSTCYRGDQLADQLDMQRAVISQQTEQINDLQAQGVAMTRRIQVLECKLDKLLHGDGAAQQPLDYVVGGTD